MPDKNRLEKIYIDNRALAIVEALQSKRYTTYLVGGCVRDLLIGLSPKDYDIGTIATPQQVKRSVPNSYIIGKRFRLVLAKRGDDLYEIATFRREVTAEEKNDEFPQEDNTFGTAKQDALRRDFTVNGLFYDPSKDELIDHCGGWDDLKRKVIRMIGDPDVRLIEDPVRILRAIRLAHKIQFTLEPQLRSSMQKNAESLADSSLPRRREELLKFLMLDDPSKPFLECYDLGVLKVIAPILNKAFEDPESRKAMIQHLRSMHDAGFDRSNPVELFAGLIYPYIRYHTWKDPEQVITNKMIESEEELTQMLKMELGLYNLELETITKAFKIQHHLHITDEYRRKGIKRQLAVLKNSGFRIGLHYAKLDGILHDADWFFWCQKYESNWTETVQPNDARKRTRNRNRKRKPRPKAKS